MAFHHFVGVFAGLLLVLSTAHAYETCGDVFLAGIQESGEYDFERNGKPYKMFCEFNGNHGFTYLPRGALEMDCDGLFGDNLRIEDLQTDKSQVMIRFRNEIDQHQYNTLIQALPQFDEEINLYVNGNGQGAYKGPVQTNIGPYMFAGITKKAAISAKTQQGFKSNGETVTFNNCDSNPNAYFAFYSNPRNAEGKADREDSGNSVMARWRKSKTSTAEDKQLPANYFYDVEAHWGGCGAYEWTRRWATPTKFALGIAFELVLPVAGKSCEDVYLTTGEPLTGRYNLDIDGKLYEVFCEFDGNVGYTFFPKQALTADSDKLYGHFPINKLQTDTSNVLIRFDDGEQFDTRVSQLEQYKDEPIGIYINGNGDGRFQGPRQTNIGPYMMIGFIPQSIARSKTVQGFRTNGEDMTFTNCDSNPNSYFAFMRNGNDAEGIADNEDPPNRLIGKWRGSRVPTHADNYLPADYFMDVEAHWGGCGGYEWTRRWATRTGFALGIGFKLVQLVEGESCEDVYKAGMRDSGSYELKDKDGDLHEVFCQFDDNRGYTFIPRKALSADSDKVYGKYPISDMQTDKSRVMIRINDGQQYNTLIEQLDQYAEQPISVYVNGNGGLYQGPLNNLKPFIYTGILPKSIINKKTLQGFKTNGLEQTFTNCDANANAYFAFFPNPDNVDGREDTRDLPHTLIGSWFDSKDECERHEYLPETYFMDLEIHFGGCGGLEWTKRWAVRTRFALGFGFGPVNDQTTTEAPEKVVTEEPEPEPTPGPAEPEPEPKPVSDEPNPTTTVGAGTEKTDPPATAKATRPTKDNKDCHRQKEKFAAKYAESIKIFEPVINKKCRFAEKQCNDEVCYCVRKRTGKPRFRKMKIPKDEPFECDYRPRGCLKKRFAAIIKGKSFIPKCMASKNRVFEGKQCDANVDECWCVKKRGRTRRKIARGPSATITCPEN